MKNLNTKRNFYVKNYLKEINYNDISKMATQEQIPQELNQQQALELLVSGVNAAQRKGAFSLEEAELLARACRVFVKPAPAQPPQSESTTPQPEASQGLQTPAPQQSLRPPVNDPQNVQTI